MPEIKTSILVVEDDESVRNSVVQVLSFMGHRVRSAADGVAALIELRSEVPDVLFTDLNMPRMSGYELLAVVRQEFPAMYLVATSGDFPAGQIPEGVTADAYYQKASGVPLMLQAIAIPSVPGTPSRDASKAVWVQQNSSDARGTESVTIACPECFRTFPRPIDSITQPVSGATCIYCHRSIYYDAAKRPRLQSPPAFRPGPAPRWIENRGSRAASSAA